MGCISSQPKDYSHLAANSWGVKDVSIWMYQLGLDKYVDIMISLQVDGRTLLILKKEELRNRYCLYMYNYTTR